VDNFPGQWLNFSPEVRLGSAESEFDECNDE